MQAVLRTRRTQGLRPAGHLAAGALALAAVLTVGAGPSLADTLYDMARQEGALTVYLQEPSSVAEDLVAGFKQKYEGISVDYFRSATTQIAQRVETEAAAGQTVADVFTVTERRAMLMDQALFAAYRSPHLAAYPAELNPDDHLWSTYSMSLTSFAWNTALLSEAERPKTWQDLVDPKWQGKIGMQDPLAGGGVASWIATMYAVLGEEAWEDYMSRLGKLKPLYGKYMQVQDMLGAGEVQVMPAAYPDYIQSLKDKGAPVEWGAPSPMIRYAFSIALTAKAPHPNAGKLFVDFILSPDGQAILARNGRLPALKSEWPPEVADRLAGVELVPSADAIEKEKFDFFQEKMKAYFGAR